MYFIINRCMRHYNILGNVLHNDFLKMRALQNWHFPWSCISELVQGCVCSNHEAICFPQKYCLDNLEFDQYLLFCHTCIPFPFCSHHNFAKLLLLYIYSIDWASAKTWWRGYDIRIPWMNIDLEIFAIIQQRHISIEMDALSRFGKQKLIHGFWYGYVYKQQVSNDLLKPYEISIALILSPAVTWCSRWRGKSLWNISIIVVNHDADIIRKVFSHFWIFGRWTIGDRAIPSQRANNDIPFDRNIARNIAHTIVPMLVRPTFVLNRTCCWKNNRDAGDLRRHDTHVADITEM